MSTSEIREKIYQVIKKDTSIPAVSSTVSKLQNIIHRQDVSLNEITQIVEVDPGLASKYLKLANSPAFYFGGSVDSIDDALVRIGFTEVYRIAVAIGIANRITSLKTVNWRSFLLHSFLTARLTDKLSQLVRFPSGMEYITGLLHDVGKLFLEHYFPNEFEYILKSFKEGTKPIIDVEKEIIGITHCDISSMLCEKWKLGPDIIWAVKNHHDPIPPHLEINLNEDIPNKVMLSCCLFIANKIVNNHGINIHECKTIEFESLPNWDQLSKIVPFKMEQLNIEDEVKKSNDILESFNL